MSADTAAVTDKTKKKDVKTKKFPGAKRPEMKKNEGFYVLKRPVP